MNVVWKIRELECYPEYDGDEDVVCTVHWSCHGEEVIDGVSYKAVVHGYTKTPFDASAPFVPYNQLTEEQIFNWCVEAGLLKSLIELKVQQSITEQANPKTISPPLPWGG